MAVTILNVDDDTDVRDTTSDFLRAAGYTVIEASSGREALVKGADAPDLVILDVQLPDISGIDVCRTLKSRAATASTPVLMLSGVFTSRDDQSGGLESGADGYLTKPITQRELVAAVESLLRTRRDAHEARRHERRMHEAHAALASVLLTTLEFGEVLRRVGDIARVLLGVDVVRVWVAERDGGLRLVSSTDEPRQAGAVDRGHGHAFAETVLRRGGAVVIADAPNDTIFREPDPSGVDAIASVLGVPMVLEGEAVGVLACSSRARRDWSPEDVARLETIARQASIGIRNARLYEASERRRRSAEQLAYVGRLLSTTLDPGTVSQVIADSVLELLTAASSAIYRVEANGDLVAVAVAGELGGRHELLRVPRGVGIVGLAVRDGRPAMTSDLLNDPRISWTPEALERVRWAGARSGVAMPLVVDRVAIGALAVLDGTPRSFEADELQMLEAFASQAVLALENARRYSESEHRRRTAESMLAISRALVGPVDFADVLRTVTRHAAHALGATRAVIFVFEGDVAVPLVAQHADGRDDPETWKRTQHTVFRLADFPVVDEMRRLGHSIPIDDVATTPLLPPWWAQFSGARSVLVAPLMKDGQAVGALGFGVTDAPRRWRAEDVELASAIAGQVALVIDRARLVDETRRRQREAEVLAELAWTVNERLDPEVVLRRVAEAAEELVGGDQATIALRAPGAQTHVVRYVSGSPMPPALAALRIEPGEGLGGLAILTGRALRTDDYERDPRLTKAYLDAMRAAGIHASMVVPIVIADAVEGLLYVNSRRRRAFTDQEEILLRRLADHAGLAIRNAELFVAERDAHADAQDAGQRLRELIDSVDAIVAECDATRSSYSVVSRRAESMLGYPLASWLDERDVWISRVHPDDRTRAIAIRAGQAEHPHGHAVEYRMVAADGRTVWIREQARVVQRDGRPALRSLMVDVTERKRTEVLLAREKDLLEMVAAETPLPVVLDALCRAVEEVADGMLACVMLLAGDGVHLHYGAAPNLPAAYVRATDGAAIGPGAGSCGAAAHDRVPVIVTDVATSPLWADCRDVALTHGLRACWSMPLLAVDGEVLGTIATYGAVPRTPSDAEHELMVRATHLARIAIERSRTADALRLNAAVVDLLMTVAVAANEADTLEGAVQIALEAVCAHTGWPVGHLYLHDAEHDDLVPTRVWHVTDPAAFDDLRRVTGATRMGRGQGLPGRVLASGRAEFVRDMASADAGMIRRPVLTSAGVRSALAFPVFSGTEVVAVLEFFTTGVEDPDPRLLETVTHVGAQLGRVVERARGREALERSADELRAGEARYRALVMNMPGMAWAADRDGHLIWLSPRVARVLGYSVDDIRRKAPGFLWSRIDRDDVPAVRAAYRALFDDRVPLDHEFRMRRKDGRWIWVRSRGELITEASGTVYASGVLDDVTERKQATQMRALLLNQVISVQEEERKRIARELHDDTAQAIASLRIGLERVERSRTLKAAREEARALRAVAANALREVRRLSSGLRPRLLDDFGLAAALERFAADFGSARKLSIAVDVTRAGGDRLPPDIEIALYRIAQEALANVARHAGTTGASILLERTRGAVALSIVDEGRGFAVGDSLGGGSPVRRFGLHNIRERAAAVGGFADIRSTPGAGTRVRVEIPVPPAP